MSETRKPTPCIVTALSNQENHALLTAQPHDGPKAALEAAAKDGLDNGDELHVWRLYKVKRVELEPVFRDVQQ